MDEKYVEVDTSFYTFLLNLSHWENHVVDTFSFLNTRCGSDSTGSEISSITTASINVNIMSPIAEKEKRSQLPERARTDTHTQTHTHTHTHRVC